MPKNNKRINLHNIIMCLRARMTFPSVDGNIHTHPHNISEVFFVAFAFHAAHCQDVPLPRCEAYKCVSFHGRMEPSKHTAAAAQPSATTSKRLENIVYLLAFITSLPGPNPNCEPDTTTTAKRWIRLITFDERWEPRAAGILMEILFNFCSRNSIFAFRRKNRVENTFWSRSAPVLLWCVRLRVIVFNLPKFGYRKKCNLIVWAYFYINHPDRHTQTHSHMRKIEFTFTM